MDRADQERVQQFLGCWLGSSGNKRANYQGFFLDLCRALGVEGPPPKGSAADDPYCFDKDIRTYSGDKTAPTTRFADFYKEGHFLIEAKQGSTDSSKGHGKRGTRAYRDVMQKAFNQARSYTGSLVSRPPFLMTCDIGSHFEVGEGFSGEYGSYGARQQVNLNDLAEAKVFERFVKIFTDPQALNPEKQRAKVTREVAAELAKLSRWLEDQGHEAQATAGFLMRCIFTMFAEDVGLLKEDVFTKALRDRWIPNPNIFQPQIEELWRTMNTGGTFGFDPILKFNGSFFEDARAIALPKEQLDVLHEAAAKDWSQVEPAIFGTLVERALEKKERSRLGAHYTPRSYVERLVRPVVMKPLRQEWDEIELEIKRLLEPDEGKEEPTANQRKKAEQEIRDFLDKLRTIKILDPACGTGNFLYVSLDLLKGLEQEVSTRLVDVVGNVQLGIEQVNPSQFLGIEINPRAAAIAELVIWIGYLQWYFKRYGNAEPPEPVLQAFGNIECRDAVLAYDGKVPGVDEKTGEVRTRWGGRMMTHPVTGEEIPDPEDQTVIYRYLNARAAEWPEADYIVSNPPFIGNKRMRFHLGDGYTDSLRESYVKEVPTSSDYVMYWWSKAADLTQRRKYQRFGFIATNSLTQLYNRQTVEKYLASKKPLSLDFAIPDHPWVDGIDGAAVRISMTACSPGISQGKLLLAKSENLTDSDGFHIEFQQLIGKIQADLSIGADVSNSTQLKANENLSTQGVIPLGTGFRLDKEEVVKLGFDPEKLPPAIKYYKIGRDLTQKNIERYIIDFYGLKLEEIQEKYLSLLQIVIERVKPERDAKVGRSKDADQYARDWWLFAKTRSSFRPALLEISRYIATCRTATHRTFVFLPVSVLPDAKIVGIALDDAYFLGVLSSRIHTEWALKSGGWLGVGNDANYNHSACFIKYPFPEPTSKQKQKIRELGDRLDTHRKQVQAAHPEITITGMYNLLEKLRAGEPFTDADREYNNKALVSTLKQIHDDLDIAVLDAYSWPHTITNEQILENLVALNAERAEEERNGLIRWLRPEYQAPEQTQPQQVTLEVLPTEEPIIAPVEQQRWPTKPKEQLAAIRDLLRTTPGEWSTRQIAAQFKGNITKKKLDAITENLERLEWFGLIVCELKGDIPYWHYAESAQAA